MNQLEHFYYGRLIHHESATGEPRVLARSRHVTDEQVSQLVALAQPPALPNAPRTSWGVLRGNRDVPYFLVQAQHIANTTQWHYLLLSGELLRQLQGFIVAYAPLIQEKMPSFSMLGDVLPPLTFADTSARNASKQADDLLELMGVTRNNTRNIEPMVSAVISGRTLVIRNAPSDMLTRANLVQGLLTLLPASTRFGVSFLLHETRLETTAQIIFSDEPVTDKQVGYDFNNAAVVNAVQPNEYARFIVSQLRLDTGVAVQQADALTQAAGWRFRNGDKLAEALDYASYRAKIDQALTNNLPIATADVAHVLDEDPTLDDDQRAKYARHILSFGLALGDTQYTDSVAIVCAKDPFFAQYVLTQFRQAMDTGKAPVVFRILSQWMVHPQAPKTPDWVDLLNRAALLELKDIVTARSIPRLKTFLEGVQGFPERAMIQRIIPKIVEVSVPMSRDDALLPTQIMLLAMSALDRERFQALLAQPDFARYLPKEIKRLIAIMSNKSAPVPVNALLEAAQSIEIRNRDEAIMQFADMAQVQDRLELIDANVLREMARIGATSVGKPFINTILNVARTISDGNLSQLAQPAPRYILQLFIASRRYDLLLKSMSEQSREIYGGERQEEYVLMLQEVFAETRLEVGDMRRMLDTIRENNVRDIPYLCIICGTLEASTWAAELADYANFASGELTSNAVYQEVIHFQAPLALLRYHLENRNSNGVTQIAQIMPLVTASKEDRLSLMGIRETYNVLIGHERLASLAFEVLRQYVRIAQPKAAQRIVEYYSKELGKELGAKLRRALDFSAFSNRLTLDQYAAAVHVAADLLENALGAYARDKPTGGQIQQLYETLRVRVSASGREQIAEEVLLLGRTLLQLARQVDTRSQTADNLAAMTAGKDNPRAIVDIFRVGGGKLLRSRSTPLRLKPSTLPTPFSEIPPQNLYDTLLLVNAVLRQPFAIYPLGKPILWTSALIHDELDSILRMMPADVAQQTSTQLGNDWQRLADLIPLFLKDADTTVLDADSKAGKKLENQAALPKNTLEFFRYLYGLMQ